MKSVERRSPGDNLRRARLLRASKELTASAKHVALALLDAAVGEPPQIMMAQTELARACAVSLPTAGRLLDELEAFGFVTTTRTQGEANVYTLHVEVIDRLGRGVTHMYARQHLGPYRTSLVEAA